MKKISVVAALLAAVVTGFVLQQTFNATTDTPVAAIESADLDRRIEFELKDLEGTHRNLTEWDGTARVINFWATWCEPCRREIPLLIQLQADIETKHLQVIGVAVEYAEDVIPYAEHAQFNYPILVGQDDAIQVAEQSGIDFIGLPFTLVISADRELVLAHMGEIREAHIDRIVEVMTQLERGETDLDTAREALRSL